MRLASSLLLALVLAGGPHLPAHAQEGCPRCPASFDEVSRSPALLWEQIERAEEKDDVGRAFRFIQLLRTLHPNAQETHRAYEMACRMFRATYVFERIQSPDGIWATSDVTFMYQWLSSYFVDDEFPQEKAEQLLLDTPRAFYQGYVAFAGRPYANPHASQWDYEFESDNGRLQAITARRKQPATSTPGADAS